MAEADTSTIKWNLQQLEEFARIAGIHEQPRVSDADMHTGIEFDGKGKVLFIDHNPLEGVGSFEIEVVFRQDWGGEVEQRILHIQVDGCPDRVLLETRMGSAGTWYADTYVEVNGVSRVLANPAALHPCGSWFTYSLVCGNGQMAHMVDGIVESSGTLETGPLGRGNMSLGARYNKISWFKGGIHSVRFTRKTSPSN